MSSHLVAVGVILLFVAIALIAIGAAGGGKAKVAVGGFIGPLPFGFGNDPELVKWVVVISIIVAALFIIFALRGLI